MVPQGDPEFSIRRYWTALPAARLPLFFPIALVVILIPSWWAIDIHPLGACTRRKPCHGCAVLVFHDPLVAFVGALHEFRTGSNLSVGLQFPVTLHPKNFHPGLHPINYGQGTRRTSSPGGSHGQTHGAGFYSRSCWQSRQIGNDFPLSGGSVHQHEFVFVRPRLHAVPEPLAVRQPIRLNPCPEELIASQIRPGHSPLIVFL